jgi:hypothetical protein
VWQEKRAAIAQTVEALGDQFRPAMRAGWLSYISKTYPDGDASSVQAVEQGPLVVGDDGLCCAASAPAKWADFCNEYSPKSQFRVLK